MDSDLRRRMTDVIYEDFGLLPLRQVWTGWVKLPVARLEREWDWIRGEIMKKCKTSMHNDMYDLVEIILRHMNEKHKPRFTGDMNAVLAENMSAWRIEGDMVVLAMGEAETGAIREAASISEENAGYVKGALKAMGPTDPDFEGSITQSFKMAESTLVRVGGSGSGLGRKLDSVVRNLEIPGNIVESFKQINTFANEFARHPHGRADYESDRNDAMLALVWFSAMSTYLHNRWRDRGGGK